MIESKIEKHFLQSAEKIGGFSFKALSPSIKGIPDRIYIYQKNVYFIEFKTILGKLSLAQEYVKRKIIVNGGYYVVLNSKDKINDFFNKINK